MLKLLQNTKKFYTKSLKHTKIQQKFSSKISNLNRILEEEQKDNIDIYQDQIVDPLLFNSPLFIQAFQKPIFPQNIYATQVSKEFCKFIDDNKIQYIGAFVLKDDYQQQNIIDFQQINKNNIINSQIHIQNSHILEEQEENNVKKKKILLNYQDIIDENEDSKSNKQYLNVKGRLYEDKREKLDSQEILGKILRENYQLGSNVIYDDNLVPNYSFTEMSEYYRKGIFGIQDIEHLYKIGTLCDIQFESYGEQGQKTIIALLRGIKKIQLINQTKTFIYLSKYKNIHKRLQKIKNKEKNIKVSKQDEILVEEDKNAKQSLINFVQVQPIRPQNPDIDHDKEYQRVMESVLETYQNLKKNFPINLPDLTNHMIGRHTLDILGGFIAQSNYFSKEELMTLFQAELKLQRLNLCKQYFEKYEQELQKYKKKIDSQKKNPKNKQNLNKKIQYEQIYEYLKNYLESPSIKNLVKTFLQKVEGKTLPPKIFQIFKEEISNLEEITEQHQEFDSTKQLLELITDLPWGVYTQDNFDLESAKKILDDSHFGIDEVKQRILEFIAVSSIKGEVKGKNILLVGPPGTGKTSVASAIAECLGRNFQRISVGGESDVAIIKGHRKTYVGSYPGKIVKAIQLAQSQNPVILIDELEKTTSSHKGNIQEALLQILDPIQNDKFVDNFLEFEIDLSKVLFICSANLLDTMHPALLDRLEVIELSGYTSQEKMEIFKQHILKKSLQKTGLDTLSGRLDLQFTDLAIQKLMIEYAREPGMRNLERKVKEICEKVALKIAQGKIILPDIKQISNDQINDDKVQENQNQEQNQDQQIQQNVTVEINEDNLKEFVGLPLFPKKSLYPLLTPPGVIRGLAYNSYGGSLIYIESTKSSFIQKKQKENQDDKKEEKKDSDQDLGGIKYTGSLGEVMKESVEIAYSNVKYLMKYILNNDFFDKNFVHIHFTEGATPKDGPSAGISIASSLISLGLDKQIQTPVAMTGELSATGKVIKIGGLREKILAAKRENIFNVIIPSLNEPDFKELRDEIKQDVNPIFVSDIYEVINALYPDLNVKQLNQNQNPQQLKQKIAFIQFND